MVGGPIAVDGLPHPAQGGAGKRPEMRLATGKEYHRKTTGPHQMWATDASYFRVVGWGYYYCWVSAVLDSSGSERLG